MYRQCSSVQCCKRHGRGCVQALCKLASLPAQHLQQILHPKAISPLHSSQALSSALIPISLKNALQQQYNESQQQAICACLSAAEPFTLIQVNLAIAAMHAQVQLQPSLFFSCVLHRLEGVCARAHARAMGERAGGERRIPGHMLMHCLVQCVKHMISRWHA